VKTSQKSLPAGAMLNTEHFVDKGVPANVPSCPPAWWSVLRSPSPAFLGREGHWAGEAVPALLRTRFAVPATVSEERDVRVKWPLPEEALCKTDASDGREMLDTNSISPQSQCGLQDEGQDMLNTSSWKAGKGSCLLPTGESSCQHKGCNPSLGTWSPRTQPSPSWSSSCSPHESSLQQHSRDQPSPDTDPGGHLSPPTPQADEQCPWVALHWICQETKWVVSPLTRTT